MVAFFIIGIVIAVAAFALAVRKTNKIVKAVSLEIIDLKKEFIYLLVCSLATGVGVALFFSFMPTVFTDTTYFNWNNITGLEYTATILGGFFSGVIFTWWIISFRLFYYQKLLPQKLLKILHVNVFALIVLFAFSLWLLTEGHANHFVYPLINGISFNNGISFTTAKSGKGNIAWYALCILAGAIACYFIGDHLMYQKFGKHGLLESTFYIAFPAGIIGARIFYVIGNWQKEFANQPFWKVFAIWEGGLTILGGAVFGIIAGVLWFKWRHPKTNLFDTVDIACGSILFAQAIGRWGNFFNCEVHGGLVPQEYWNWIPTIIRNQMTYSSTAGTATLGYIYAPLFFIEMLTNLLGFIFLDYVVLNKLNKVRNSGDSFGLYMIWYGFTRTFMEPLRDSSFNMGVDGKWSWIWSIFFVAIGILFIVTNHFIRYLIKRKKEGYLLTEQNRKHNIVSLTILASLGALLLISGLTLMTTQVVPSGSSIQYCAHNLGIIFTIIGGALFVSIYLPITKLIIYKKENETH